MHEQLKPTKRQITKLKSQLGFAQLALEKLAGETSRTEADLRAHVVAVEEALNAGEVHVERLECGCETEDEKKQQLIAKL